MGKKSRDLPTILNDLYGEIFGNIGDKEEKSGVVKLKKVVVDSVGNYGKVGYWVKDLIIHYGWFSSTEQKGWTYCKTRNKAKRVKAINKALSISADIHRSSVFLPPKDKHWFDWIIYCDIWAPEQNKNGRYKNAHK